MKLVLDKPAYLKDIISIVSTLVTEGKFNITKSGISLASMDSANIAFVGFNLLKECFSTYQLKEDISMVLNINELKKIFDKAGDDVCIIEDKDTQLVITLKGKTLKKFVVPTLDVELDDKKGPNLEFSATIHTKSSLLNEAISVANILQEQLTITVYKNEICFSTTKQSRRYSTFLNQDVKITTDVPKVEVEYALEYITKFCAASKISDKVRIELKDEYPVKFTYKVPDKLEIYFILAPRVKSD